MPLNVTVTSSNTHLENAVRSLLGAVAAGHIRGLYILADVNGDSTLISHHTSDARIDLTALMHAYMEQALEVLTDNKVKYSGPEPHQPSPQHPEPGQPEPQQHGSHQPKSKGVIQ